MMLLLVRSYCFVRIHVGLAIIVSFVIFVLHIDTCNVILTCRVTIETTCCTDVGGTTSSRKTNFHCSDIYFMYHFIIHVAEHIRWTNISPSFSPLEYRNVRWKKNFSYHSEGHCIFHAIN